MKKIIVLLGASATGKDTVAKHISEKYNIPMAISYTTRPMRSNETQGVEYYFISDDEMHEKYEAMTREELMKKHIEISWIADAAKFFSQLIEWYYIKGLVVDLKNYFRDAQNLKDLIEKYKKPEPETLEMIKPRSKKIERKSRSDWEAERKAQEAKREEERKFFQEFGEEDELPLQEYDKKGKTKKL